MNRDFMKELKQEFSFLDISDDTFEKVFNRCINSHKSDEENKNRVRKVFYNIIKDNIIETGDFFDVEQ